jgi:predicted RNA binding protein YcfA (HicA-like mRNA interferase family)
MPKLPRVSGKRAIAALERLGFAQVRSRGSHVVMARSRPDAVVCVVPAHDEDPPRLFQRSTRTKRLLWHWLPWTGDLD